MATTKGGLAKRQAEVSKEKPIREMQDLVLRMQDQINMALTGTALPPERFTRIVLTTLSSSEQLQKCTPITFLGAMMQAAQLGLEPNTPLGQAYLIPYRNHGRLECQFQVGYKGNIDLFYRYGGKDLQAKAVYENDTFEFEFGLEPKLRHVPAMRDRAQATLFDDGK